LGEKVLTIAVWLFSGADWNETAYLRNFVTQLEMAMDHTVPPGKGFHFGVHTHIEHLNGRNYNAVYGYIVIPGEKEQIKIVRQ
jgi:hypothetical protein